MKRTDASSSRRPNQCTHHTRGRRQLAHPAEVAGHERDREQGDHALGALAGAVKDVVEDLGRRAEPGRRVSRVENSGRILLRNSWGFRVSKGPGSLIQCLAVEVEILTWTRLESSKLGAFRLFLLPSTVSTKQSCRTSPRLSAALTILNRSFRVLFVRAITYLDAEGQGQDVDKSGDRGGGHCADDADGRRPVGAHRFFRQMSGGLRSKSGARLLRRAS